MKLKTDISGNKNKLNKSINYLQEFIKKIQQTLQPNRPFFDDNKDKFNYLTCNYLMCLFYTRFHKRNENK